MPDSKISQLSNGAPAQATDEIPINRSGQNYKLTAASIAGLTAPGGASGVLQYNNAGVFGGASGITTTGTELTIDSGIKTASTPIVDISQTWNNSGVVFTGFKLNVTNTNSAGASLLLDLQVGGSSKFKISRDGAVTAAAHYAAFGSNPGPGHFGQNSYVWRCVGPNREGFEYVWGNGPKRLIVGAADAYAWSNGDTDNARYSGWDVLLYRDAAAVLALRNDLNAQTFRIYNTYSSSTNYERGKLEWSSSILKIGTEKGSGGGSARGLELQTDGVTRMSFGAAGGITVDGGTVTTSTPIFDMSQTWNDAAVTFTGLKLNATNTASNAASKLLDMQVGGTSQFSVRRDGAIGIAGNSFWITTSASQICLGEYGQSVRTAINYLGLAIGQFQYFSWVDTNNSDSGVKDTRLYRDGGAGLVAQRNGLNAQTFRIYNTYSSSTNYERGKLEWSSSVFYVGTEKGSGGGSARSMEFQTDGTTRLSIATDGSIGMLSTSGRSKLSVQSDGNDPVITNNGTGAIHLSICRAGTSGDALKLFGDTRDFLIHSSGAINPNFAVAISFTTPTIKSWYNNADFIIQGHTRNVDEVRKDLILRGGPQHVSSTVNLSGGHVKVEGGAGASSSAGAAHGGSVYIDGGRAYGTGTDGNVIIGATRGNLQITDARNIILGTTTGTKIGTGTDQKIGFYNATPVAQQTTAVSAASFTANSSGIDNDTATFDGYTIGQIVKALRTIGILA